jgi:hypothetical protein
VGVPGSKLEPAESAKVAVSEIEDVLKQRLRQLTKDNRALDERLQAARSNSRFQDRRIAQLKAHLFEPGRPR